MTKLSGPEKPFAAVKDRRECAVIARSAGDEAIQL
jgi:hypothetical protein